MFTPFWKACVRALHVSRCAVCQQAAQALVCEPCTVRFGSPRHRCLRCARAMVDSALSQVNTCGACLKEPPAMARTLAAADYGYPWDRLLIELKFVRDRTRWRALPQSADPAVARPLASIMLRSDEIVDHLSASDWITPVPLHASKQRERGFNQSWALARALVAQHPARQQLKSRLLPDALLRVRDTPAQIGLSALQRQGNLRHAFAANPLHAKRLAGRRVALIDDVATTGSTLSTAAQALLQAGAAEVTAIVFARTTDG